MASKLVFNARPTSRAISVTVSPTSVTLTVPSTQQLTATVWSGANGTGLQLIGHTVTWSSSNSSVASVSSTGLVTAVGSGSTSLFAHVDGVSSTAITTNISSSSPGTLPEDFDPNRDGFTAVVYRDWNEVPIAGDNGYAGLLALPGGWSNGTSGPAPSSSVIGVYDDPRGVFGKVLRQRMAFNTSDTGIHRVAFGSTLNYVWVRYFVMHDGLSCNMGGAPSSGGPYPTFYSSGPVQTAGNNASAQTIALGGTSPYTSSQSGTYKECFVYNPSGSARMEYELKNDGFWETLNGQTTAVNSGPSYTSTGQGIWHGGPVPPVSGIRIHCSSVNAGEPATDLRGNEDWYEMVIFAEIISATEYRLFYGQRRITNGVLAAAAWPTYHWRHHYNCASPPIGFNRVWISGNKSGYNEGPGPKDLYYGPLEVSTETDPYGYLQFVG